MWMGKQLKVCTLIPHKPGKKMDVIVLLSIPMTESRNYLCLDGMCNLQSRLDP